LNAPRFAIVYPGQGPRSCTRPHGSPLVGNSTGLAPGPVSGLCAKLPTAPDPSVSTTPKADPAPIAAMTFQNFRSAPKPSLSGRGHYAGGLPVLDKKFVVHANGARGRKVGPPASPPASSHPVAPLPARTPAVRIIHARHRHSGAREARARNPGVQAQCSHPVPWIPGSAFGRPGMTALESAFRRERTCRHSKHSIENWTCGSVAGSPQKQPIHYCAEQ
jgi:hypothetical protein